MAHKTRNYHQCERKYFRGFQTTLCSHYLSFSPLVFGSAVSLCLNLSAYLFYLSFYLVISLYVNQLLAPSLSSTLALSFSQSFSLSLPVLFSLSYLFSLFVYISILFPTALYFFFLSPHWLCCLSSSSLSSCIPCFLFLSLSDDKVITLLL